MTPRPGIGLQKSKSLGFVGKEKFLKSVGVKSNNENMMKSNDGIFFHRGNENEVRVFLGDSLNKHFSRKKKYHGCLMKKAAATCVLNKCHQNV